MQNIGVCPLACIQLQTCARRCATQKTSGSPCRMLCPAHVTASLLSRHNHGLCEPRFLQSLLCAAVCMLSVRKLSVRKLSVCKLSVRKLSVCKLSLCKLSVRSMP